MYRFVHNLLYTYIQLYRKICICIYIVLEREAICNEYIYMKYQFNVILMVLSQKPLFWK